ncbi:hypothetical protein [Actinacidiphila oryziradicis]|uniref:DUF8083 domain-containing protein n=1 Tax=Actinacidiphila oryziradicis TaxID=2571141 RepID=A0A4U0SQ36_9ACTN|nr:hypothetical protein [Actinacidiphila oryziradicis]MCW2875347.1 uncharacterized protein [Actinacidiphila oryziradicis]TKA11303.1 hypothetical protein FCI23_13290 [Actinacidiphila oryziradicis]
MGLSSVLLVPYAAYLRVYEPLAAFPEPERTHWYRYAAAGPGRTAQDELRQSLAGLTAVPPVPVPVRESGDAFVAVVDGVTHVCPWRTRLRGWQALEALEELLPEPVLDAVLPAWIRSAATTEYEEWRAENPDARPWIRSATWHVPVRWFVLFDDAERTYEPSGGGESKQPVLRYRTPMVQARRRTARALRVLKESLDEGPLVEGLVEVGRWLEEFHPRSMVELDYGGLVHIIPENGLAEDHSAADTAEGLAALREGDSTRAGEAYERLAERWRSIRELQYAS